MRSTFLWGLLLLFMPSVSWAADRPNVLFIAVDDLNHWVGYTGRNPQAKTPNIDRLASRGVTFTRAYCAVPACNPSRAALMSGMRASTTGCYHNQDFWTRYIPEGKTIAATFKQAGYSTWGMGKIFHSDSFYESEWDEYPPLPVKAHGAGVDKMEGFHDPLVHDLRDEDLGDWHTVDYCIGKLQQVHDQPFFLACGLHKPHLPFAVPRKYYDSFPLDDIEFPPYQENDLEDVPEAGIKMARPQGDHQQFKSNGRWRAAIQSYLATVAYTDMNIGRLLDAFDASPHRDNTIIVLWGDHGWHFGEKHHWRKFALWEEATCAPLIWVAPGVTHEGAICERVVDFMTIYPTLCDLTRIPVPEHVEGASIRSLLEDPQSVWETPALTTHGYRNHSIRTDHWRYIRYANGDEELYDHTSDPYEWVNLARDPATEGVRVELAKWLPKMDTPPRPKENE
ncbi:MAG: sulfatase [Planctomycetaceae bacterium]|nr:sulfatase [Planctomycetaceae bacterium]